VSEADLRGAQVQAAVGDQYTVQTGRQSCVTSRAGSAASIADAIGTGSRRSPSWPLFVGCFIIYNTFTIVVTQRLRELACSGPIGAERQAGAPGGCCSRPRSSERFASAVGHARRHRLFS
jgi:hypothetical protein